MPAMGTGSGTGLTASLVEGDRALADLSDGWRALAEAAGNAFLTPEWDAAWWRHYGGHSRRLTVAVRDTEGALVGVLPMAATGRRLHFAGAAMGDQFAPVCDPSRAAEVAAAAAPLLATHAPRSFTLVLDNVSRSAPWTAALLAAWPRRTASTVVRPTVLPYLDLDGHTWDSWKATRSRNFRSQIGRRTRALERDHGAMFRRTLAADEVEADLDRFFSLHHARWDTRGGSTSQGERIRAFHQSFASSALERDWLRLWFLEVEGQPVATWYGWRIGGAYAYYLAGFDPEWSKSGVGLTLLAHTVQEAFSEGADTYEFLLGDEEYKGRFASDEREVHTLLATSALHPLRALNAAEARARALEKRLPEGARARVRSATRGLVAQLPSARRR